MDSFFFLLPELSFSCSSSPSDYRGCIASLFSVADEMTGHEVPARRWASIVWLASLVRREIIRSTRVGIVQSADRLAKPLFFRSRNSICSFVEDALIVAAVAAVSGGEQ